jgi:hypothetical protein
MRRADSRSLSAFCEDSVMGKYFLGWLLGVPAGLLILIYIFFHFF